MLRRARAFVNAGRGVVLLFKSTPHAWIQFLGIFLVVVVGWLLEVSAAEMALLILAEGMVMVTEAINTAIEIDINLTSPEYHPYARDTKDVAAAAVLIASCTAAAVGVIVFVPYLW